MRLAILAGALVQSRALTIAVTGATGRLGRRAVQQLVAAGHSAKCLVRHDADAADTASDDGTGPEVAKWLRDEVGATLVRGDVVDADVVDALCEGSDAVLALHGATRRRKLSDLWRDATKDPAHAKNVNYHAIGSIISAADKHRVKRVVRVTGKGETPWSIFSILINLLGSHAKTWNYEGERLLRAADVDYTIVRPGVMSPGAVLAPRSLALADDGGDLKVSAIPHAAIAELCVKALDYPNAARTTLCAMAVPEGEGAESYDDLLPSVRPDRRTFRDDLLQEHLLAVRVGGAALVAGFGAFWFTAFTVLKAAVGFGVRLIR